AAQLSCHARLSTSQARQRPDPYRRAPRRLTRTRRAIRNAALIALAVLRAPFAPRLAYLTLHKLVPTQRFPVLSRQDRLLSHTQRSPPHTSLSVRNRVRAYHGLGQTPGPSRSSCAIARCPPPSCSPRREANPQTCRSEARAGPIPVPV